MKKLLSAICVLVLISNTFAQNFSQWRGPSRTGVYNETELLKKWTEPNPKMLWFNDSLPSGFSSVAIANNKIYLTGLKDSVEVLAALDIKGQLLWETTFGKAWSASFPESRATPTVEKNRVYVSSGTGDIACIDAESGKMIWSFNPIEKFEGKLGRWGLSESILIDDEKAYYTPGGDQTMMIALKKETGELVWESESLKDNPSYTSPLMIERNGKKQIIQVSENYVFGIQPDDGKIKWKFEFGKYKDQRNNNTNTPLYSDNELYITSGYNHKSVKLKLADNLQSVSLLWVDSVLDTHIGGVVKVGDYIYGSNWLHNRMGNWVCLDWKTGEVQYETEWKNKGSIIAADGMLYCYEEKEGYIALVEANPKEFKIISQFQVPKGQGSCWAHPVINDGILYLRRGKAVMAFDIKSEH